MYKAFNLLFDDIGLNAQQISSYADLGRQAVDKIQAKLLERIRKNVLPGGSLDGTAIQSSWFPSVTADVFLSHSHGDEELTLAIAGLLNQHLGLTPFVDSVVWGYCDELLRALDKEHCWQPESETYNYSLRNQTTSHVHMMLTAALNSMVNRSECIFFLNTPKSISSKEVVSRTKSPWIYAELTIADTIQIVEPQRIRDRRIRALSLKGFSEKRAGVDVEYAVPLKRFSNLLRSDFVSWLENCTDGSANGVDALDSLYQQVAQKETSVIHG